MRSPLIIAIDFDGTICDHIFPGIGKPVPGAVKWIKEFQEEDAILVLWTMRSDGQEDGDVLTEAVEYCKSQGIIFDHINENPQDWTTSNKAYAHVYIDDAAFGCPLKENPRWGGRPYVDWDIVGPAVLDMIKRRKVD